MYKFSTVTKSWQYWNKRGESGNEKEYQEKSKNERKRITEVGLFFDAEKKATAHNPNWNGRNSQGKVKMVVCRNISRIQNSSKE